MIGLPEAVRNKARLAGADRWLRDLDLLVADLAAEWSFRIGRIYDEGTEALVAEAVMTDGTDAVLKILIPRDDLAVEHEIAFLELVDGDGCPRLYHHDLDKRAMLLERLGPSLHSEGRPIRDRQRILCDLAQRVWRPAPDLAFPTGADKGRWLVDFILAAWERAGRPVGRRAVDHALACAERRIAAHDPDRSVLVHGDVHEWNALSWAGGYKLIDPDGLHAEPEYDLGVMMREDPLDLLAGDPFRRADHLASLTGCDPVAIWEWGVVERVSTGLVLLEVGVQPLADEMLMAAEVVAR